MEIKKNHLWFIAIIVVLIVLVISFLIIKSSVETNAVDYSDDQLMEIDGIQIGIDDYYYGDYNMDDSLDFEFDKYLTIDLNIENISNDTQKVAIHGHFKLKDKTEEIHDIVLTESGQKLKKELQPGEDWKISITFPVKESDVYYFYYSPTLKDFDEQKYRFILDNHDLDTKKVEETVDHTTPKDIKNNLEDKKEEKAEKKNEDN